MSIVLDNLNNVLRGVLENKTRLETAVQQAQAVGATLSPEVQSAVDLLLETFSGNAQQIGQILSAQLQLKQMERTAIEVAVLVAALQTLISNELSLQHVQFQMEVNAQPDAPLSDAAGTSEPSAAIDSEAMNRLPPSLRKIVMKDRLQGRFHRTTETLLRKLYSA